jgi:TldD protein
MPMKIDPFTISADEKASKVLAINATALQAGADFCTSALDLAREERLFANSHGSSIFQVRGFSPDRSFALDVHAA